MWWIDMVGLWNGIKYAFLNYKTVKLFGPFIWKRYLIESNVKEHLFNGKNKLFIKLVIERWQTAGQTWAEYVVTEAVFFLYKWSDVIWY